MGSIKNYLQLSKSKEFKEDQDKYTDFPIEYADASNVVKKGFIQSVVETIEGDNYHLEVIVLDESLESYTTITKKCIAPKGCTIEWDTMHCPTSIV